jgi:hypothetical protein
MAAYDVAPLNSLGARRPYRVRIRCVKRSGGDIGNSPGPAFRSVPRAGDAGSRELGPGECAVGDFYFR